MWSMVSWGMFLPLRFFWSTVSKQFLLNLDDSHDDSHEILDSFVTDGQVFEQPFEIIS